MGAALYAFGDWRAKIEKEEVSEVVEDIQWRLKDFLAPPFLDRPLTVAEVETTLCKWKSHVRGSYPINNDLNEIRHGLHNWQARSELASVLLTYLPDGVTKYQ